MKTQAVYDQVVAAGVKTSNHCSDLYAEVTEESTAIIKNYAFKNQVTTFINALDGKLWYDIPFAFSPYWEKRK